MSESPGADEAVAVRNQRLLIRLGAVVVGMFLFAVFVMPPIYEVFCELTGLNGKTSGRAAEAPVVTDASRRVTVEFLVDTDSQLPWDFSHDAPSMEVHPGEIAKTVFHVRNRDSREITGRAIPSVSPNEAAQYLRKTECFCFGEQTLKGGAAKSMPMIFYIDPGLPAHIRTVTLSYKFYNQTHQAMAASR